MTVKDGKKFPRLSLRHSRSPRMLRKYGDIYAILFCLLSVANTLLCILIEDVDTGCVNSNLNAVACSGCGSR